MNTLLSLLPVIVVVVVAVLVWNYRRQAAAREAASAERMKALLGKGAGDAPVNLADVQLKTAGARSASTTPQQAVVKPKPQIVSGYVARAQLLPAQYVSLYRLLQSALPQHEVYPSVSLKAFVQIAENSTGFAREAQERRLTDTEVDFLICDKAFKPLAAIHCAANRVGKAAEMAAFTAACVVSVGMRWVELSPEAPPAPDAIRAQVLGA